MRRHALMAAALAATVSLAACSSAEEPVAGGGWDPAKAQLTEQRLETLTEIAREMRDANGGQAPAEWVVMEEIKKRNPDALVDGYGRPFRYTVVGGSSGSVVTSGFEFVSDGADPNNVADDVKRGAVVEQRASG